MSGSGLHDFHNRVKASQGLGSVRNDDRDQISSKVDQKLTPLNPFSRVRASKLSNLFKILKQHSIYLLNSFILFI